MFLTNLHHRINHLSKYLLFSFLHYHSKIP
nr:MAG TPA: hypothetical protein [Crassvirales sp.]